MSQSQKAGVYSCVVRPELKAARPSLGGKYGRMSPALPSCEEHRSLAARDLQRGAALGLDAGWTAERPLWHYVLKEAEVRAGGEHLGPVGGRIVAEPCRRPTLPSSQPGEFGMADLIVFAGAT